jgi:hypothetical protein
VTPDPRTRKDRLQTRLRRLESLEPIDAQVCANLRSLVEDARSSFTSVAIRSSLVRRPTSLQGSYSDRRLPPEPQRPPAARLLSPRGVAPRVYLTAMLWAQTRPRPGKAFRNTMPIRRHRPEPAWLDYVAAVTDAAPDRSLSISVTDQRERQFKNAVKRLASPGVRLVDLPAGSDPMNKYEGFILLDESGDSSSTPILYTVPRANDKTFALPSAFFTSGWVHTLTTSEIAALMMMADVAANPLPAPVIGTGINLSGDERMEWFCLTKDTYDLLADLVEYGLLDVDRVDTRRPDGTVELYNSADPPRRNYYTLKPAGFNTPALPCVTQAVARQRDECP